MSCEGPMPVPVVIGLVLAGIALLLFVLYVIYDVPAPND